MLIDVEGTAKCLTLIYKGLLDKDNLPRQWKSANVTPIHKGGAIDSPYNFRLISLTSIPCKMMEHIVLHHLNIKLDSVFIIVNMVLEADCLARLNYALPTMNWQKQLMRATLPMQ